MLEAPREDQRGEEEFPFPRRMSKCMYLEPVVDLTAEDYWTRERKWRRFWEEQSQIEPKSGRSPWYDDKINCCYRVIFDDGGNYVARVQVRRNEYFTRKPIFQPDHPGGVIVNIRFLALVFSEKPLMQDEFRKIVETELAGIFSIRDSQEPISSYLLF